MLLRFIGCELNKFLILLNQAEIPAREDEEEEKQLLLFYLCCGNHNFFDSLFSCDLGGFAGIPTANKRSRRRCETLTPNRMIAKETKTIKEEKVVRVIW